MKLNDVQICRTLSQFRALVLAEDHPAVAQFCELFGHHTFFLDASGLNVLELLEVPGMEAQDGEVIRLAEWSDTDFTSDPNRTRNLLFAPMKTRPLAVTPRKSQSVAGAPRS